MSTLGELINRLAIQGGIDANADSLKAILTNTAVSGLEIDNEIVSAIDSNLLTVESAKNNPDLKNHFYALALGGVDNELKRIYEANGFDESLIGEINSESSSYKRIGLVANKIKELESAKQGQSKDGQDKLQVEIERLHNEMKSMSDVFAQEKQSIVEQNRDNMKNLIVKTALSSYDYSLPTSKDVSVMTAENIIMGELAKQGGTVVMNDNNELVLKQANNPEMDFYVGNNKVDFRGFAETTLGTHKLLKTTDTPPATPPGVPPGTPPGTPPSSNPFANAISKNISDLESAND